MRVVTSPSTLQRLALRWKRAGRTIGLVPTMGYLHEGHLSLVRRARRAVGRAGVVVASIYVNPTQFAPGEDLSRYPRDFPRDARLCRASGVDVLFCPTDAGMYPGGEGGGYSTYVVEERLGGRMEGVSRPAHFRGVTTVVAKLFNLVLPDVAVFGAKDFQQAAIIARMVRDLNFPVRLVVAPTIRERDGLAMSSRNKYLTPAQRVQAVALFRAIQMARTAVARTARGLSPDLLKRRLVAAIQREPEARVDYIEFVDPNSLEPVRRVRCGVHMTLAVFVGKTRLIDNGRL